jgi:hypothetical protein
MLAMAAVGASLLAGVLNLTPAIEERWGASGAWIYPVGDPHDFAHPGLDGDAGYLLRRSVGSGKHGGHQGADLSNQRAGGVVRAAAAGLVLRAATGGWNGGYGRHVVVAHRAADGLLTYSVYAHLAPGSVQVRAGEPVSAGQPVGRVGMSGRASSAHLHFEVRLPDQPDEPWEHAPVTDPLSWVEARLPPARADSTWARPYLEWAESAALLPPDQRPDARVRRDLWWRILALGARGARAVLPEGSDSLGMRLAREGLVDPDVARRSGNEWIGWGEISDDLTRAQARGFRVGPCPVESRSALEDSERELGWSRRSEPAGLARRAEGAPTIRRVCLALAELTRGRAAEPPTATRGDAATLDDSRRPREPRQP